MFTPVFASVLTTLAAFSPLMIWPGISGKFMRYLPVTVFVILAASLAYALIFAPVIGSLLGRRKEQMIRIMTVMIQHLKSHTEKQLTLLLEIQLNRLLILF